jgi:hypothetical protein
MDHWYQSGLLLVVLSACPRQGQGTKSWVFELVSIEEKYLTPKKPSMAGENKDGETRDPFKLFLEESLAQKRNEMMDNFA